jgi:hypothetical protein
MSNPAMIAMGRNWKTLSSPFELFDLKPRTKEPMTVKELHTFTDAEIDLILDALGVAASHYQMIVEKHGGMAFGRDYRQEFLKQADDARALRLKIEAAK